MLNRESTHFYRLLTWDEGYFTKNYKITPRGNFIFDVVVDDQVKLRTSLVALMNTFLIDLIMFVAMGLYSVILDFVFHIFHHK